MNDLIKSIISDMDTATDARGSRNTLVLLGDNDSVYLRGIERRAEKLGLRTARPDEHYAVKCVGEPVYVYDTECKNQTMHDLAICVLSTGHDIDCITTPGLSCCAEACEKIVNSYRSGSGICTISGRGHSVQGLAKGLAADGHSVANVHTMSNLTDISYLCNGADVLVSSSPIMIAPSITKKQLLLDVRRETSPFSTLKNIAYISSREIGALNISILLRRFTGV